jgi:hypothetical protein
MSLDAPDWQRLLVTVNAAGDVPDAPDWERIAVAPGGQPIGPTPGGGVVSPYYVAGFKALTVDPATVTGVTGHATGVVALIVFTPFTTFTVNYVYCIIGGTSGLTPNENYLGIYDCGQTTASTYTLLCATAAGVCDTAFATGGYQKIAIHNPVSLSGSENYALALLNNGANPSFDYAAPNNSATPNPLSTNYPFRSFSTATHTTLPTSIAYSAVTLTNDIWMFFMADT